jgi:hypothetical protein
MEVLEQTSKIIYTNSQTAMQQEASKIVENMSGGWLARTASKISINPKTWFKNLIEFRSPQNASKLAEAFVNPDYFSTINQLMKMPNTVDRAIKVSAFIGGLVGREELIPGEDVPLSSEKKVK